MFHSGALVYADGLKLGENLLLERHEIVYAISSQFLTPWLLTWPPYRPGDSRKHGTLVRGINGAAERTLALEPGRAGVSLALPFASSKTTGKSSKFSFSLNACE